MLYVNKQEGILKIQTRPKLVFTYTRLSGVGLK